MNVNGKILAIPMIVGITFLAGSAFAGSGYNEFVSACSTRTKVNVCKCIAGNLKAKDVSDDQARYLSQQYKNGKVEEKTDDETVELEWFESELAANCLKNYKFRVQE
jgi:hypothetical protein